MALVEEGVSCGRKWLDVNLDDAMSGFVGSWRHVTGSFGLDHGTKAIGNMGKAPRTDGKDLNRAKIDLFALGDTTESDADQIS